VDAYFLSNKLQFTGDIYKKNTSNMLLQLQIPSFMGFSNPDQNAGTMETSGWDLELSWRDKIGQMNYTVSANLFDSKTLMKDLSGTEFKGSQITAEGTEYQEWYGYKSDGLFQTQEEIDNSPVTSSTIKPGDVKYQDVSGPDGVPDGVISPDYDRVTLGGSLPRYQFGSNLSLDYKSFDFSLTLQGVGKQLRNISAEIYPLRTSGWENAPKIFDGNYWSYYSTTEENLSAKYPRLSDTGNGNNYTTSDFWLVNGAYLRIKNINLGYSLPHTFVQKLKMQQMRLYINISDLYTFDKLMKGYDVESVANYGYPITSTFLFGVTVKF